MSLIMCISTQEGLALAGDSIEIINSNDESYDNAFAHSRKVFVTPSHVGILTCGNSTVQGRNIQFAIDAFIEQHAHDDADAIAHAIGAHFRKLRTDIDTTFIVAGHVDGDRVMYRISTKNNTVDKFDRSNDYNTGALWNGYTAPISRLINVSYYLKDNGEYVKRSGRSIPWGDYHLQDAVDLLRFLFDTTIGYYHFTDGLPRVSKPIDILVITPEGHQWIQKKELH